MEDLTLALITLTSFVLLFVVAIFADRAGIESDQAAEPMLVPVEDVKPVAPAAPTAVPSPATNVIEERHVTVADADVA